MVGFHHGSAKGLAAVRVEPGWNVHCQHGGCALVDLFNRCQQRALWLARAAQAQQGVDAQVLRAQSQRFGHGRKNHASFYGPPIGTAGVRRQFVWLGQQADLHGAAPTVQVHGSLEAVATVVAWTRKDADLACMWGQRQGKLGQGEASFVHEWLGAGLLPAAFQLAQVRCFPDRSRVLGKGQACGVHRFRVFPGAIISRLCELGRPLGASKRAKKSQTCPHKVSLHAVIVGQDLRLNLWSIQNVRHHA